MDTSADLGRGLPSGNGTAMTESFVGSLVQAMQQSTPSYATAAVLVVIATVMYVLSGPRIDDREPPVLKSKIPIVGHLIGMIRHQSAYFKVLE